MAASASRSPSRRKDRVPTYEYRCDSCRRRYERRESFSAPSSHPCQRCERGTATRILHAPTVVFKGSGFYVNDSRKSESGSSSGDSSGKSDKSAKSEKSSKSAKPSGEKASAKSAAKG